MKVPQFSLLSLLLLSAAALVWLILIVESAKSTCWGNSEIRWLMMPVALVVATAALQRLVWERRNSWALTALLAGAIIMAALGAIFLLVN